VKTVSSIISPSIVKVALAPQLDPISQDEFDRLMARSKGKVYNLALRLSSNRQDAEDLTQEAYFRAYRNFKTFEGDRPFENWIMRIVTRLFLDLHRARKRRVQTMSYDAPRGFEGSDNALITMESAADGPNAEDILMDRVLPEDLEAALLELKPDQRQLVIMADVEQIPYQDIAVTLGVPVGTVRSRLHRSHKKLQQTLAQSRTKCGALRMCGSLCMCANLPL